MFGIIKEIINRRSLIWELALKNLKIRYSRPFMGFFWTFLTPFLTAINYYIVFSIILRGKVEEMPFFLYIMSAVFPWNFFASSIVCSTSSLVDNKNLIKESRFPQYLIPVSIVLENMIVFLPSLAILIIASLIILDGLPIFILYLPVLLIFHSIITIGLSIIFSILYVKWRDLKYVLEIILLFAFYLMPSFYSIYLVKDLFSHAIFKSYMLSPFTGMLSLYRIVLFKGFYVDTQARIGVLYFFLSTIVFAFLVLLLAVYLYRKNRNTINDYLSY